MLHSVQFVRALPRTGFLSIFAVLVGAGALVTSPLAQDPLTLEKNGQPDLMVARDPDGYWTPAQLQGAEALDVPIPSYPANNIQELEQALSTMATEAPTAPEAEELADGADVAENDQVSPDLQDQLYSPTESDANIIQSQGAVVPLDEGTMRAPFSSSRLVPTSARVQYPYRTVGRLFFVTRGGRNSWCSAAVLRPRIILTAGHCVHQGSAGGNGWHSRWLFVPAYHNGQAPYQAWNWRWVVVTGSWASSNGQVPNRADFAIIELEDRKFGASTRKIGAVTGYLGYHTNILQRNHTKKLGYPGNHDRGEMMHQVDSQNFRSGGSNTMLYGSDMRGGSSGGPWVMNFGRRASGQTGGLRPWPNRIVGVTSYGYVATGPKVQGSSILNNEFLTILSRACNHRPGNC